MKIAATEVIIVKWGDQASLRQTIRVAVFQMHTIILDRSHTLHPIQTTVISRMEGRIWETD